MNYFSSVIVIQCSILLSLPIRKLCCVWIIRKTIHLNNLATTIHLLVTSLNILLAKRLPLLFSKSRAMPMEMSLERSILLIYIFFFQVMIAWLFICIKCNHPQSIRLILWDVEMKWSEIACSCVHIFIHIRTELSFLSIHICWTFFLYFFRTHSLKFMYGLL